MIATISMHPQRTGMQDHRRMLSLTANAAGKPLPLIPRRPQSHLIQSPSWPVSLSSHSTPPVSASPTLKPSYGGKEPSILASASIVTITPATPPKDSDPSPPRHGRRRKRNRVPNPTALYPPELSTPMPAPRTTSVTSIPKNSPSANENATTRTRAPLVYTPGMPLRLSLESLRKSGASLGLSLDSVQSMRPSLSASDSLSSSSSLSSVSNGSTEASPTKTPLIRKKSGQVLRPSLKSSSSYSSRSASHLGIMAPNPSFPSSKSEPVTPFSSATPTISKAVHFDKNLEQVKLFLAQQKPLAVSREGSPGDTDDGESASGSESNEIARFFGSPSFFGDPSKKFNSSFGIVAPHAPKLVMHTNITSRSFSLSASNADATLESLVLAKGDNTIQGCVLVRNIAFDKSVIARFSFDGWCTTSEVNAKWKEGLGCMREGGTEWDRFEFTIWLGDLKLGEEKGDSRKMELAVRYRVASRGYELWDNNGGRNYVATFERPGLLEEKARGRKARPKKKAPLVPFSDDELSDLLEKVATSKTKRKSRSISPTVPMSLYPSGSTSPLALHTRTRSFPFSAASSSPSKVSAFGWIEMSPPLPPSPLLPAWLTKKDATFDSPGEGSPLTIRPDGTAPLASPTNLGSPRDLADFTFHSHIKFPTINGDDPVDDSRQEGRPMRRHQRGGCFHISDERLKPQESTITVHDPAEPTTPTPSPSSRFHSFPPLGPTFRDSTGPRENQKPLVQVVNDVPMDSSHISSASFIGQVTPSTLLPSPVEANMGPHSPDETSDSSSLLENESPASSRSSTPPSEEELNIGLLANRSSDDCELYREFLNRFCFFTGPGSPSSISDSKNMMEDETTGSESESTPTLMTPSTSVD